MSNNYGRNYTERKPTIMESITLGSKTAPEIKAKIAILGDMNDRHKEATGSQDKQALRALANEYEAIGCPRLANEIRDEAKGIRKRKRVDHTAANVDVISDLATPEMVV